MKNLFIGGASEIALELSKYLKDTDSVTSKTIKNSYRKNFKIKNYNIKNINNLQKKIIEKYDNVVIFNGFYSSSFLSMFQRKNFLKDFEINFLIPIEFSNFVLQRNILKKGGAIYFISSLAASEDLIGNAVYSISKNAINISAKILSNEQKRRNIRVNVISLGLIKNSMGLKVKKLTNTDKKYISLNVVAKKIKNILKNKKINKKNIKILS
mgnify:FL=1